MRLTKALFFVDKMNVVQLEYRRSYFLNEETDMFVVPSEYAFPLFALLSFFFWCLTYAVQWETRSHQLWISRYAVIGAPLLNWWYTSDFWQPHTNLWWFILASVVFGWSFLGCLAALVLGKKLLVPDQGASQGLTSRYRLLKYLVVSAGLFMAALVYFGPLRMMSVSATTVGLITMTVLIAVLRPALIGPMVKGGFFSVILLITLLGIYLGILTGNGQTLASELSSYYVKRGSRQTGEELLFWAFAFGAFFGPFAIWTKNLRPSWH
jgi:hypothetical protein